MDQIETRPPDLLGARPSRAPRCHWISIPYHAAFPMIEDLLGHVRWNGEYRCGVKQRRDSSSAEPRPSEPWGLPLCGQHPWPEDLLAVIGHGVDHRRDWRHSHLARRLGNQKRLFECDVGSQRRQAYCCKRPSTIVVRRTCARSAWYSTVGIETQRNAPGGDPPGDSWLHGTVSSGPRSSVRSQ